MRRIFSLVALGLCAATLASAQDPFIPRRQSQPPGPPLSPQQAIDKMTVPDGFHVELVASEPDLLNPVAMAFDDRGRIWVTESFEYPRHEPGPGRDRVKILEDTDGDGRVDSVKIFADGLNIPSGIAIGHGGVWVANAPDILFLEDTDGDDRADRSTVVATGFGRDDTHELPNALTWGPDGYLYGLNGVFNRSTVRQGDREFNFTCAMFRIDPVTKRFDLFCEGTSNPWGITFDDQGSAFISACVIDHLWHLTETGYYHRQAGAYPPHTWKIESIVSYKHQMAAYCGIEYFDSPAYPEEYRRKLYMGNIHGGCINVDSISRLGSTYRGKPQDDFLTANDVWFMPVAQKTGPDGCLYVLDWYDRYHCYQDASADPKGVDRGHGRLYRIVHGERPAAEYSDLATLSNSQLVSLLGHDNIFYRQRASVLLAERLRNTENAVENAATVAELVNRFTSQWATVDALESLDRFPLYELTTLLYAPQFDAAMASKLLSHSHPLVAAWSVRAGATREELRDAVRDKMDQLTAHGDPRVRLQAAIAASKLGGPQVSQWLLDTLEGAKDDGLLPKIVWRNLVARAREDQTLIARRFADGIEAEPTLAQLAPRWADRVLADLRPDLSGEGDKQALALVVGTALQMQGEAPETAAAILGGVVTRIRGGEIQVSAASRVLAGIEGVVSEKGKSTGAMLELGVLASDAKAIERASRWVFDDAVSIEGRLGLIRSLSQVRPDFLSVALDKWRGQLEQGTLNENLREAFLDSFVRYGDAEQMAKLVVVMPKLEVGLQASIASQMCQREATAVALLGAIRAEQLPRDIVGPNQVRSLATGPWSGARESVAAIWGAVRAEDSAERSKVVREMTQYLLKDARGDAKRGLAVWNKVCGQCHRLHGEGFDVGPELTSNGRGSFEQLVVSVFDPSLVIGSAYQAVSVLTVDGRVINGIVTERSDARIVLKVQGGKSEVIPMDNVEEVTESRQSLMPEGLETQISREEIADLFALLSLKDRQDAKENEIIPGTPEGLHRVK